MQAVIVALMVLGSGLYAGWAVAPAAWRQALARWLWRQRQVQARPWLRARLQPLATGAATAACSGCEGGCGPSPAPARSAGQPVQWARRRPPAPAARPESPPPPGP